MGRVRRVLVGVSVTSAMLVVAGASGAMAAKTAPQRTVVPSVGSALVAGKSAIGATAATAPVRISIVLKPRRLSELKTRTSTGWWHRGNFLSVPAFADRYGQPSAVVASFLAFLRGHGLQATAYRDRLNIAVKGTAAQINSVFAVKLQNYKVKNQTVRGSSKEITLPTALAKVTLGVLGLTNYHGAFHSNAIPASKPGQQKPAADGGPPPGQQTPGDFLRLYHGNTLQRAGKLGAGQTIGIVTLATLPKSDPITFWKLLHIPVPAGKITTRNIDGGAGPISFDAGSDETSLDVEQSGAIAPQAKIIVYQAPNTDAGASDAFFTAVSENKADSFSISWGESETIVKALTAVGAEPTTFAQTRDVPLLEAAAQGQANFGSSGDEGAYSASAEIGATNLTPQFGTASSYTTSAGGTTLPSSKYLITWAMPNGKTLTIKIPRERAWGWDYRIPAWREFNKIHDTDYTEAEWAAQIVVGGGGGISQTSSMPSYQSQIAGINSYSAVKTLTPIGYTDTFTGLPKLPFKLPTGWALDTTPPTVNGTVSGSHRLQPDLSANADPETGYGVYSRLYPAQYGATWVQFGGTSFTSPQFNGISALIQAEAGGRVGFWNPFIYRLARSAGSPITPLNGQGSIGGTTFKSTATGPTYTVPGNNNMYWQGKPGTKYNMGSGLGIPNLTRLGQAFSR